jgi:hypothetical protein
MNTYPSSSTRRGSHVAFVYDVLAIALIVGALAVAVRTTRDLNGAGDLDHFRDIAQAQTVRDGHPLSDPYYRGEWTWYNPLLAWTLAAGSWLHETTVETYQVHAGPWLNLLGPLAFYLLAVRIGGRRAAVAGLVLYLFFVTGNERSWASATYSPWLFVANFAQGFFFLTGLALLNADENPNIAPAVIAGALMGVTFLTHTAPALILAATSCIMFARRRRTLLAVGLTAFVVASPFLVPLAAFYRFHVVHAQPVAYEYPPISLARLPELFAQHALLIGAATVGLWLVRSRFGLVWLLASLGFLAYTLGPTPPLLPGFHFWLYTTAALSIFAGCAIAWLCPWPMAFVPIASAVVLWNWQAYSTRADLRLVRFYSLRRNPEHFAAAAFLRRVTKPDDVVVGTYGSVRLIIGPAGRKTIAPDPNFANPYRDFESRAADRDRMLAAINVGDLETVRSMARKYHAAAVVSSGDDECTAAMRLLSVSWRFGDACISMLE